MEEIQGEANFRRQEIRKQGELTKRFSDTSLNSLIEKEEFSTSKVTKRNEWTDIVVESLAKNVTDNRKFRRKKSKQQREVNIVTRKETDSNKTLLRC